MKRQTYLAMSVEDAKRANQFPLSRIVRGHITLIDEELSKRDDSVPWSTSVFAKFVPDSNELKLQLVFLHFIIAPITIEHRTFDLYEGGLIARFRFVGSLDKEAPELVDQLASLE